MNADEVLRTAEAAGVTFHLAGGSLRFEQPTDRPLPAGLFQEIGTHKRELAQLVREQEADRPELLPPDLTGALQGRRLGAAIEVLRRIDKVALDCGAALGRWSGIDGRAAGDQDFCEDLWRRAQKDADKWRAIFESLREANYQVLTAGRSMGDTARGLAWIWSTAQSARSIGADLKLIKPRPDDLVKQFQKFKNVFHETR